MTVNNRFHHSTCNIPVLMRPLLASSKQFYCKLACILTADKVSCSVFFCEPFVLWGVGLAFRLFEETLLKISLRYHKQGNSFYALIFILAPSTPQIMRFLCISLHHKFSCNLVYKENMQRNNYKPSGFCDRLKQQYSHSRGFVPLCGDGWRDEGRREFHLLKFPQSI